MTNTVNVKLKNRSDIASKWTEVNPTLSIGEIGFESDTGKLKIGDGETTWNSLPYLIPEDTIAGDGTINKVVSLTWAEYQEKLNNGDIDDYTIYNITDDANGSGVEGIGIRSIVKCNKAQYDELLAKGQVYENVAYHITDDSPVDTSEYYYSKSEIDAKYNELKAMIEAINTNNK